MPENVTCAGYGNEWKKLLGSIWTWRVGGGCLVGMGWEVLVIRFQVGSEVELGSGLEGVRGS